MKKKIILLCLLIISSIDVFSQINTITGKDYRPRYKGRRDDGYGTNVDTG